jgi:hypothetical protein
MNRDLPLTYIAFCVCVLLALAWADWRGWSRQNCEDQFQGDWSQEGTAQTPFHECLSLSQGSRSSHSIRNRSYQGGK